ncbi:MAG: hypothetical protein KKE44_15020 [Proteobacteria bacterium]|nr:hypothetical protein [Pseudomonadota bacterium]MBU1584039.1 hypothetical protein [Pseudomonadota bacterium]MBU2629303.1 hypothetical protein [Pseudomonadota bacterium]
MAEKKKRLSLAARIAQENLANTPKEERINEQTIISFLSPTDKTPEKPEVLKIDPLPQKSSQKTEIIKEDTVRSRSGQGQVDTGLTQGRPKGDTVSPKDQVTVKSVSGQGQVSSIRSGSGQGQVSSIGSRSGQGQLDTEKSIFNNDLTECILAPQQQNIYTWFLNNGITGYFNKGQIQRDTGINHPTIRKSIAKLSTLNIIEISEYDPVSRHQKYRLNPQIKINILSGSGQGQISGIRSGSSIGQVSSIGSGSGQGQLDTEKPLYKIDRKILKNLSIYLDNSDYWKGQGLTIKKCEQLINEIDYCDSDFLLTQLQFGEHSKDVTNSDRPISYFRTCLLSGGLERPKDFELPEEKAIRIKKKEIEDQEKFLAEQEIIRKKEKELADKQTFNELLKDREGVDFLINQIEKRFVTAATKISIKLFREKGKIDSKLERALERELNMSDSE